MRISTRRSTGSAPPTSAISRKTARPQKGDRLIIDFMGKIDGEAFPGGSTEDAPILLGGGNFIPGFEEGLIGAKAGEEREVEATFPDDYPEAALAGKTARFEIKIKEVAHPRPRRSTRISPRGSASSRSRRSATRSSSAWSRTARKLHA